MAKGLRWVYAPEGAKRRYEAHFVSKLTDADGRRLVAYASESENSETDSSLDFAEGLRVHYTYSAHKTEQPLSRNRTNARRHDGKAR